MPRRRLVHDPFSAPSSIQALSIGTWRCTTRSVLFKFDRWGYYTLFSSVVCTFFMYGAAAAAISMIRWWFWRSWPNRAQGGIQYSMDNGFGRWNGLKRCITYNAPLEPHICHLCGILSVMPRQCNISKWKAMQTIRRHRSIKYILITNSTAWLRIIFSLTLLLPIIW